MINILLLNRWVMLSFVASALLIAGCEDRGTTSSSTKVAAYHSVAFGNYEVGDSRILSVLTVKNSTAPLRATYVAWMQEDGTEIRENYVQFATGAKVQLPDDSGLFVIAKDKNLKHIDISESAFQNFVDILKSDSPSTGLKAFFEEHTLFD